jgi:hypothetical protein
MSSINETQTRMEAATSVTSDRSVKGRPSFILASSVAEAALGIDDDDTQDLSKQKTNDLAPLPIISINKHRPLGVSSLLTPKTLTETELKALAGIGF